MKYEDIYTEHHEWSAYIRHTHPYGYRNGQWAEVFDVIIHTGRPCFVVRFIDNSFDIWPIYFDNEHYEFSDRLDVTKQG